MGMEKNEARPCSRYVTQPGVQQATALCQSLMDSWYAAQKLMALNRATGQNLLLSFEAKSLE